MKRSPFSLHKIVRGGGNSIITAIAIVLIALTFLFRQNFESSTIPTQAASCSIPSTLSSTLEITPSTADNVIDCSGQTITIANGGVLVLKSYTTANATTDDDGGVLLKVGSLIIDAGGTVTATGYGYTAGVVDGGASAGVSSGQAGGSGGGNAGGGGLGSSAGGANVVGNPGVAIGLKEYPAVLGGAGGGTSDGGVGGRGGGAIHIQATGTVTVNGNVYANGENGVASPGNITAGGGGAGGSIWVEADIITGTGQVVANGGSTDMSASYMGGGGSGGRVALVCVTSTDFPVANVSVNFGEGSQDGQPGTLVGPGCKPPEPTVLRFFETGTPQSTVSRELGVGKLTTHTTITFASNLATDTSVLEVEVREVSIPFSNAPNAAQEVNTSNLTCDAVPQGENVPIAAHCGYAVKQNLEVSKQYHWQARVTRNQIASNWVEFGGNVTTNPDFTIAGAPVGIVIARGNNQTATPGQLLPVKPTIRVVDVSGYGVPFYFESSGFIWGETLTGGGNISNITTVADEWGELWVDWQVGTIAGTANNTLSVRKHYRDWSATFTENVAPGAINSYKFTTPPLIAVNTLVDVDIVAIDVYGNEISGISHDVFLSAVSAYDVEVPGAGTFAPTQVTLTDGQATFQMSYSFTESIKIKGVNATNAAVVGYSNAITVANEIGFCPALIISTNTTWRAIDAPGGVYDCRGLGEFTVNTGVTLTLESYDNGDTNWGNDYGVTILADSMNIQNGAQMTADGKGYLVGPGGGNCLGASHGGYGATACAASKTPYGSLYYPLALGSGAGYNGTYGGGAIKLVITGGLIIDGTISANNANAFNDWAGSGSGGSIWIEANALSTTGAGGVVRANSVTGRGSAGRIAVYYNTASTFPLDTQHIQAYGSVTHPDLNRSKLPGNGTIYIEQKGTDVAEEGVLMADNNNNDGGFGAFIPAGVYSFKQIVTQRYGHIFFEGGSSAQKLILKGNSVLVGDATKPKIEVGGEIRYIPSVQGIPLIVNGVDLVAMGSMVGAENLTIGNVQTGAVTLYAQTWAHNDALAWDFSNVIVGPMGYWYMQGYDNGDTLWDNDFGVSVTATNITVENGGQISAEGRGYISGPGEGQDSCSGASYGGYGGDGCGTARTPYGSVYGSLNLGSGAREGLSYGGGAIKLVVSGTLRVDGRINADNRNTWGGWWRSGSGGGIWIDTENLESTGGIGTLSANAQRGKGSGGRIALYYRNNNGFTIDSAHLQAFGAQDGYDANWPKTGGGPGTVYVEHVGTDTALQGKLLVDNNSFNSREAYVLPGQYQFTSIQATRSGHVIFAGASNAEQVTITSSTGIVGDSSKSRVTFGGVLRFNPAIVGSVLEINGVDVGLKGDVVGISDVVMGNTQIAAVTLYAQTWAHNKDLPWSFGNVTVGSQGYWYMQGYDSGDTVWDNDYGVSVTATNVTVESGGQISSEGRGYISGPGEGQNSCSGASYGGYGGNGCGTARTPYGSIYEPLDLGSGATEGASYGGGAVKLVVSGTLRVDGKINADNRNTWGGGGDQEVVVVSGLILRI